MRTSLAICLAVAIACFATTASAQEYLVGASADLSSGIQGGGGGATSSFHRARSTIRLGADLRVDEFPKDIFFGALVIEMEPRAGVGGDFRYMRMLAPKDFVFVGVEGIIMPQTLFGGSVGYTHRIPLSPKVSITAGPMLQVFFLGGDLPDNTIVWQALLQIGFRADLL